MWLVVVVSRQNEQNLRLDKTEEMRRKMEGRKKLSTMMDGFVRQTHTGAEQVMSQCSLRWLSLIFLRRTATAVAALVL
jgi:hypothetical protein